MLRIFNKNQWAFSPQNFLKKNLGGSSLIEMLVIITIIGILAGILLVVFGPAREKAKDTKIESNMLQLQQLAENIYLDNGSYNNLSCSDIDEASGNCTCNNEFLEALCEDLLAQGSSLAVQQSSTRFCAYARLNSTNNCLPPLTEYFCIDSWGTNKKVGVPSDDYCMDNFVCRSFFDFDNDGAMTEVDVNTYISRYWGCQRENDPCVPPKGYDSRADFYSTGDIDIANLNRLTPPHICNI